MQGFVASMTHLGGNLTSFTLSMGGKWQNVATWALPVFRPAGLTKSIRRALGCLLG
jgi:hypothetical protein